MIKAVILLYELTALLKDKTKTYTKKYIFINQVWLSFRKNNPVNIKN